MPIKELELYSEYRFTDIEKYAEKNNLSIEDHGSIMIGECFLVLRNSVDQVTSFVLSGATAEENIYRCIYSDKKLRSSLMSPSNF